MSLNSFVPSMHVYYGGKGTFMDVNRIKQVLSLLGNVVLFVNISEAEPLDINPSVWVLCLFRCMQLHAHVFEVKDSRC